MVWGECRVGADEVVVRLRGWRTLLAAKGTIRFPLASIVRVEHDPLARAHVKTGLRQWREHGQGVWRLGTYHGLDGWSFWSIGLGRNAVLIECSGSTPALCGHRGGRPRAHGAGDPPGRSAERPNALAPVLGPTCRHRAEHRNGASAAMMTGRRQARIRAREQPSSRLRITPGGPRREGDLILDSSGEDLELPVPSCPDWNVADLVGHLGDVFQILEHPARGGIAASPGRAGVARSACRG